MIIRVDSILLKFNFVLLSTSKINDKPRLGYRSRQVCVGGGTKKTQEGSRSAAIGGCITGMYWEAAGLCMLARQLVL
jgi:hypothetical protein